MLKNTDDEKITYSSLLRRIGTKAIRGLLIKKISIRRILVANLYWKKRFIYLFNQI
jgi:hypothetical protein